MKASTRGWPLARKLQHYSSVCPQTGCWLWHGAIARNGYARCWWNGATPDAHVLSYSEFNGAIPKGAQIRHTCHVKKCVNPRHLVIGTHQDNMDDMVSAGRSCRGVSQHSAKLNSDLVKAIRQKHQEGCSPKRLCLEYQVSISTIERVVSRTHWRHVA